jgi:hypothetical protein
MRKRGKRRTSSRVTDKQEVEERKDADMALSSISYNNKDKEEEKKKKDTYLGEKDNLTSYSSSSLIPAQTRKEEEGLKEEKIATTTTTTTPSSSISEVSDSPKYDSMAEIKESAADMKREGGEEGHLKEEREGGEEGHLKEEREEVLSNIQREEEPIKSESVDTGKPSDIDLNSPAQPQQLPPSPSTITATADDMNSPSLEERAAAILGDSEEEVITPADQNLEVEDTKNVVVGKEKEDEEAEKKKEDNKEQQQQHYAPSISASYMTSWHDYVNAGFNVYSESIRAAAKIAEYSLGMFWEPWLGRYNKKKDRMKVE